MKINLLVIDPQVDFCDPNGALYVKGAEKDMERLAAMIEKNVDKIDDIQVTLDSHQPVHIAHPICWVDSKGNHPAWFTVITENDVVGSNPTWKAYNPAWQKRQVEYIKALKANGKYVCVIWPPHCLIGTPGHCVHPTLIPALRKWQDSFALVNFVTKGSFALSEHYGVVKADVPDPSEPSTQINTAFIQQLQTADIILVAGEASSHCVANSVRDIINEFGVDQAKKFVLLEDAMSPVGDLPGSTMFKDMHDSFFAEMKKLGVQFSKTTTFFK